MRQLLCTSLPVVLDGPGGVEELILDGPGGVGELVLEDPGGVRDPVAVVYTVAVCWDLHHCMTFCI